MNSVVGCPLCRSYSCEREYLENKTVRLKCGKVGECKISPNIHLNEDENSVKYYTMIYLYLKEHPRINVNGIDVEYEFYFNNDDTMLNLPYKVNVARLMSDYPKTFIDKMNLGLLNLSKEYNVYGDDFIANEFLFHTLYCTDWKKYSSEILGTLEMMTELGYLIKSEKSNYTISAKGWEKISDMVSNKRSINQGFIAMSFKSDAELISNTFKKAINRCGYVPQRIDEKEHNNQIVPEILFEISRSKFVVVDITYPNYGAYYEAGYAEALGKEVIVCCRCKEFNGDNRPHFDIAQKSMIVWNDENELEERLYRRIEATVGLNL